MAVVGPRPGPPLATLSQAQGWLWEHRRWPAAARRPDTGRPAYRWARESAAGPAGHAAVPARVYGMIRPAGWEADGFATFAEAEEALALALAEAGEIGL